MIEKKKWYEHIALLVILLIFVAPIGLIGIFLNKKINKKLKVFLFIFFSVFGILFIIGITSSPKGTGGISETPSEEISPKTSIVKESNKKYLSIGKWYSKTLSLYFELIEMDSSFYMIVNDTLKTDLTKKSIVKKDGEKYVDPQNVHGEYYRLNEKTLELWNMNGKIMEYNVVGSDGKIEKTGAEIRTEKIENMFSAWDGSHVKLTLLVKKNMNDPKSYEHVETRYVDKGTFILVTTKFRGKNAFGGLVISSVTAKSDLDGNITEIINE